MTAFQGPQFDVGRLIEIDEGLQADRTPVQARLGDLIQTTNLILQVRRGDLLVEWHGRSWRAVEGDLVVLPYAEPVRLRRLHTATPFLASVVPVPVAVIETFERSHRDLVAALFDRADVYRLVVPMSTDVETAWSLLLAAVQDRQASAIVDHLIHYVLLRLVVEGVLPAFPGLRRLPLAQRVQQVLGESPEHPWRAPDVAERLGLSEASLRRNLARSGASFRSLLDEVRMTEALNLLMTSDNRIQDVAAAVGYACGSRFTARFKARYGLTPRMLRSVRSEQILAL